MKIASILAVWVCCAGVALGQTQIITNGGFENGSAGWTITGAGASAYYNSSLAHTGSGYLSMGNKAGGAQSAYQSVRFPTNTLSAMLVFYINTASTYHSSEEWLKISLAGTNVTVTNVYSETSATHHDTSLGSNYYTGFYFTNFPGVAGQSVTLEIDTSTPVGLTTFDIDDISLTVVTTDDVPANDNYTNRITLTGTNQAVTVKTAYATKETGEPKHAGNNGGHSVWWKWTAPTNGVLSLSTSGSAFTTLLGVYTANAGDESVTNLTVVASSNGNNKSSGLASLSFGAQAGQEYEIALDGYNGAGGQAFLSLSLNTNVKVPTVSISKPSSGGKVTNDTTTVTGKASSSIDIAQVRCRVENSAGTNDWAVAQGTTNWSFIATGLVPGNNTVRVVASDVNGNVSKAVTRTFNYVVQKYLTLNINGSGKVAPAKLGNSWQEMNMTYALTATPAKGFILSNWTDNAGAVLGTGAKLSFVLTNDRTINANFIPNPFSPVKGGYAGLLVVSNAEMTVSNSGLFTLTLADKGSFSSKLLLGGVSYSLSGQFTAGGIYASNVALKKGQSPMAIALVLDLTASNGVTGSIGNTSWAGSVNASLAVYSKTHNTARAGSYTFLFPGVAGSTTAPAGYSYGTVKIDKTGNVNFSGALADGTKLTQKTFLSGQEQWPLCVSLYSGKGLLLGEQSFTNGNADCDFYGTVNWIRLAQAKSRLYTNGFNFATNAVGSSYVFAKGVPVLDLAGGQGVMILQGGGLSGALSADFTLGTDNKFVLADKTVKLTVTTSSGLFKGSMPVAGSKKGLAFNGVVFQKQKAGFGSFINTNQCGEVSLGAPAPTSDTPQ